MAYWILKIQYANGNNFMTTRHGGLFLSGEMIKHADLKDVADRLEMPVTDLHGRLIELARTRQINYQKRTTAKSIFNSVEEHLKSQGKIYLKDSDTRTQLADLVIDAFHSLGFYVNRNDRGDLILPRLDQSTRISYNDLNKIFDGISRSILVYESSEADDPLPPISGRSLYDRFIQLLAVR